jgi:hypothetical protein
VKASQIYIRLLVGISVLVLLAAAAHADSINDPGIIIRDPACPSGGCMVVGQNFTFGTPASGMGTLFFTNGSGVDWFNLQLTESGVPASAITCMTTAFVNCTVATVAGVTTIFVSGVNGAFGGIGAGENFSIVFTCDGNSCWPGDLDFTAHANIPEPATLALTLTGIAGIISRKLRKLRTT